MKSPLKRIEELIPILPSKDEKLAYQYLKKRDFQSILEIVESDIYKAEKSNTETIENEYISSLTILKGELLTYMSYLDIPDEYDYI